MATFKITADKSRFRTDNFDAAFGFDALTDPDDDTLGADSLIVDASAYLVGTGVLGIGAFLNETKAWTVTVNGSIVSQLSDGIVLEFGASTMSSITIGAGGSVGGVNGITAQNGVNIKNSGVIFGSDTAIRLNGPEAHTTNAKGATIESNGFAILDEAGLSIDKVTNAGTLLGGVFLSGKNDVLTNSGSIFGGVDMGADNDRLTNSGFIAITAILGDGDNVLNNSGLLHSVEGGSGSDNVTNTGTIFNQAELGDGNNSLTNSGTVSAFIVAGTGNDSITNSGKIGELNGGDTAITLGGGSNKLVNSGTIFATKSVTGGAGDDTFTNSGLVEGSVNLGDGKNVLTNNGQGNLAGFVTLGAGNDVVNNSAKIQVLMTGGGDDIVVNTGTIVAATLGAGNDKYTGSSKVDRLGDSDDSDIIKLGGGNDFYFAYGATPGLDGIDTIDGGTGIDSYDAHLANDPFSINLDSKDQSLTAFGYGTITKSSASGTSIGTDTVTGFEDVTGSSLSDTIYGNAAANILVGDSGNDFLGGFAGNDTLTGNFGDDDLFGGLGRDLLTGGANNDDFFYTNIKESGTTATTRDLIQDFESGDLIWLNPIDANTNNGPGDDAFVFIGTHEVFTGVAGQLRAYWTAKGQIIEGDVNGDKKADFSIEFTDPDHSIVLSGTNGVDFML